MAIYYVDTASAGGDGTTTAIAGANAAFATIAAMQAKAGGYAAGDSILFRRGCTWREQLTVPSSGSAGNPISFGAYGSGEDPILDATVLITPGTSWSAYTGIYRTAFNGTKNGDFDTTSNWNFRNELAADASSYSGTKVRVTVAAHSTQDTVVSGCSIGVSASGQNFGSAPTRITFDGGSSTTTVTAGQTKVSDEITFTFTKTNRHLIHLYWTGGTAHRYWGYSNAGNYYIDWSAGTDKTLSTTMAADNYTSQTHGVLKIEVFDPASQTWQATVTTEPKVVLFDGVRGMKRAALGDLLAAGDWFWAANVLYAYGESDLDTVYTNPGVTVGALANNINTNQKNYLTFDHLILHGANTVLNGGLYLNNSTNVTLQNSEVRFAAKAGVYASNGSAHLITNNELHNNGCGFQTYQYAGSAAGITTVSHNRVHHNADGINGGDGILFYGNYLIAEYNTIYDNGPSGANLGAASSIGLHIYTTVALKDTYGLHNILRYNIISGQLSGTADGAGIELDHGVSDAQVYYNVSYGNAGPGIDTYEASFTAYNNVCYGNMQNALYSGVKAEFLVTDNPDGLALTITAKNNIAYATAAATYAISIGTAYDQTLDITNNIWYAPNVANWYFWNNAGGGTLATWNALTGIGTDKNEDPLFVSPATGDFHLQAASPCRDAGVDVGLTSDYAGHLVKFGTAPDIGAYEFAAGGIATRRRRRR